MVKRLTLICLLIANTYQLAIIPTQECGSNRYNPLQDADLSTCVLWGNYNIKTFDDHGLHFKSDSTYTLVSSKVGGSSFRIDVGGFNDECRRKKQGCHTFVNILYNGVTYKLSLDVQRQVTFTTNRKSYQIPSELDGLRIHQPGYRTFVELTKTGLVVKWDEKNLVEVTVENDRQFEMSGLCGNNDKCSSNDQMLGNGAQTTNLGQFLGEWQVDKLSPLTAIDTQSPCRGNKARIQKAQNVCKILKEPRFSEAHKLIDPELYMEACIRDYCSCRLVNPIDCLCGTLDAYVKASNNAGGKPIAWRDDKTCRYECIGGLQYFPCAPKGGIQTCSDVGATGQGNGKCEEGCYCAPNTFFFDGKCYLKKKCPCVYGGRTYQPGDTIKQKCHTCVCTDGKFVCPTHPQCHADGSCSGDPHYKTFDGKRYDFMGKCSYYLVKGNDFSVVADHYVWEGGKFVKNYNSKAPSWTRRLIIRMEGEEIEFKPKLEVNVNNVTVKRFPYKIGNTVITKPSSSYVLAELPNAVEVQWDGYSSVTVRIPVEMEGQVMGLLGTYTEDQSDDFMTPLGEIVKDPVTFGNSWKTESSCRDESRAETKHPCEANPSARPAAEKICSAIKGHLFKQCEIDDINTMYENCVYDTCLCKEDPNKCSCDQIAMAADMCGRKKIITNWRNAIPECRLPCPAGQVYQECGNACARTCEDLSMRPDCAETCVEGCNCEPGTTMDESGKCVPVDQCKCRINDIVYPPGFQFLKSQKELLTCVNARWQSSIPTPDQQIHIPDKNQLDGKCDLDNFMVYTACRYPAPKSCQNMHTFEIVPIPICEEGCECMEGFVLDLVSQSCVRPDECPCYFNGHSYKEGGVAVQEGCNRCVCNSEDTWDCKQEKCEDLCMENEIKKVGCNTCRCKDAYWECTKHHCCPTEGESKKVDDCNVCNCINGIWECTQKECPKRCMEKNIKEDGCKICICENGEWRCNEDNCLPKICGHNGQVTQTQNGKCVCKDGLWKCVRAQCDIWGYSHVKTFDGFLYDFQGECSYTLAEGKTGDVGFSVIFTNERCSRDGATCLKSFTIEAKVQTVVETITLVKKSKLPVSNFKNLAITDHVLFVTVEILNSGVVVFWDKRTWVYIKLDTQWRKNVVGLCGNYNNLKEDDVQLYDVRSYDDTVLAFVDLWKTNPECGLKPNLSTCDEGRHKWAKTSCDVLLGPIFAACHRKVPVGRYYEACVVDSCKCDLGGDCECLCTAISTYAQMCNNFGIPINWRSQQLCPIQCSRNTEYTSCMSPCPPTTCETIQRGVAFNCDEKDVLCIEGCEPKTLPLGMVYKDDSYEKYVYKDACKQKRCKGGFYEGEVTVKHKCHICLCISGEEKCLPLPCGSGDKVTPTKDGKTLRETFANWFGIKS